MPRILITSGPTREYLDPVRFLTNASSGKMGKALTCAALTAGFEVTVVTGPVVCEYPPEATLVPVTTTDEMLRACLQVFPECVGAIGAAAPCDFRPIKIASEKIKKNDRQLCRQLCNTTGVESKPIGPVTLTIAFQTTVDIFAELGKIKRADQWLVPFALETADDGQSLALEKLIKKNGDLILWNGPSAMLGDQAEVAIIDRAGTILANISGTKAYVA